MLTNDVISFEKPGPVWSNIVLQSLKRFTAQTVKTHNIETEISEQTLFAQIYISQY